MPASGVPPRGRLQKKACKQGGCYVHESSSQCTAAQANAPRRRFGQNNVGWIPTELLSHSAPAGGDCPRRTANSNNSRSVIPAVTNQLQCFEQTGCDGTAYN